MGTLGFLTICLVNLNSQSAFASIPTDATEEQRCLLLAFENPADQGLTLSEIKQRCQSHAPTLKLIEDDYSAPNPEVDGAFLNTFEPYKRNYFSYGGMENRDGTDSFSGNTADIRFQFGMKFGLFQKIPTLEPVYFGYSQKSWWDIAESSAPFREHNYNPEIFWDFTHSNPKHGFMGHGLGKYVDQVGFEHQSNGLDGLDSRSWDRIYAQKSFNLLDDRLSLKLKVWNIVNLGIENSDIADFYGNAELEAGFALTDSLDINLTTMKGHQTGKYSYQLDVMTELDWMNGKLFLSYYDGFGEALISYNQKTRSLRAGVSFPLATD